ncbi:uncharacterized protein LOC125747194 isoform X2 [Brienomyrus brachyistius]|uniref:uncharacterized protein LOC125747194 isoform X2 n=1 Tax=Brienomyrus brachyistius TaxID=42636 RepID=UPI0020B20397|nr:uncharacterized protein LOC125747194 isoform X2 [Brienomyrus brachyistius]
MQRGEAGGRVRTPTSASHCLNTFGTMNLGSTMKSGTLEEVRQETLDFTVKSTAPVGHANQRTPRNITYCCRPLASQSSASTDASKIPGGHTDVVKLAGTPQDVSRGVGDISTTSARQKNPGFVLRKNLPVTQKPGESAPKVYSPQSSQTPNSWNGETTQEILQKPEKYIMKQGNAEYQVPGHYITPVRKQRAAPEMESSQRHVADRSPMEFYPYAYRDTLQLSLPFSNMPNPPVAIPYPYLYPHFLPYLQLQPFLQRWMKEESPSPVVRGRKNGNITHSALERDVCCAKAQPQKRGGLTELRNEKRGAYLESKLHGFCQKPRVNEESSAGPPYSSSHDLHKEEEIDLRPWFAHSMQGDPVRLSAHPWATEISLISNTIRQQHPTRSHVLPRKKRSAGFPNNHSGSSSQKKTRKCFSLQNEAVVLEKAGEEIRGKRTESHCLDYSQKGKNEIHWNRKQAASSKIHESPQMPTSTMENHGPTATPNHWRPPLKQERPPSRSFPNELIHAGHFDIVDTETPPPREICSNIQVQRAQEYVLQPEAPGCATRGIRGTSCQCQGPDSNGSLVTSQDSKPGGIRRAEEWNQTKTWVPQRNRGLCEQSSDQNLSKDSNPRRERLIIKPWAPALVNRQKPDIINLSRFKDRELPGEISRSQTQNKSIWQDIHKKDRISTLFDISQICSEKEDSGKISGSSSQAVSDPSFHGEDGPKYLTLDRGAIFRPKWHGIESVLETYIKYMEEKKIEEMALREQLKQSKAINEQLNQTVRRLRIQLQELEASKAQLVRDQMLQEAALSCLQKCLVFAV